MTFLAFLLVSPVLVFGGRGGSPELTATATTATADESVAATATTATADESTATATTATADESVEVLTATAATATADESVEVLIIRSSCSFFGGCWTSGCLDSNTLTMKSCSETNPHGMEKKSDCQKECGSFHLIKHGSDGKAHCTLGVGGPDDTAYLNIEVIGMHIDSGALIIKLQKKPSPYNWQSAQCVPPHASWLCNKDEGDDDALCINDQGEVSKQDPGNVWLARYDNGEQIMCISIG